MTEPAAPTVMPDGVSMESLWLVEATYAPDAAETRGPFRREHLERVAANLRSGRFAMAGAYLDVSSSLLLVRAASEEEALDACRDDVYLSNGVWVELRAKPFGMVAVDDDG